MSRSFKFKLVGYFLLLSLLPAAAASGAGRREAASLEYQLAGG